MGPELLVISITVLLSSGQPRPLNYRFKETMNEMVKDELMKHARPPTERINKERVLFVLYKKVRGTKYRSVGSLRQKGTLHDGLINCDHPLKIGIHGWQQPVHSKFATAMVGAYLDSVENVQVVIVRWLAADQGYVRARLAVPKAAKRVHKYLQRIRKESSCFDFEDITLIGHSLGAHVAGATGNLALGAIGTIVALDPANPLFWENSSDVVNVLSAQRVIGVHTSPGYYGIEYNVGHVDFWPNMGVTPQPGCNSVLGGKGVFGDHKLGLRNLPPPSPPPLPFLRPNDWEMGPSSPAWPYYSQSPLNQPFSQLQPDTGIFMIQSWPYFPQSSLYTPYDPAIENTAESLQPITGIDMAPPGPYYPQPLPPTSDDPAIKGSTSTDRETGAEELSITDITMLLACSHEKSIYYFFDTVRNPRAYRAGKCECTHYGCVWKSGHRPHHFNEFSRAFGQYCFYSG